MALPAPPPGWGGNGLTTFFDDARENQYATFHNKKPRIAKLIEVDDAFVRIAHDWTDPVDFLAACFFARSHSAFRAGCSNAIAGQFFETFATLRLCLELASYAALLKQRPELGDVWGDRQQSEAAAKAMKDAFTQTNVRTAIAAKNQATAQVYQTLYQDFVDFGAHPNVLGVAGSMQVERDGNNRIMSIIYLHADGPPLDLALKSAARAGVNSLHIFADIFPERYQQVGAMEVLPGLRQGL